MATGTHQDGEKAQGFIKCCDVKLVACSTTCCVTVCGTRDDDIHEALLMDKIYEADCFAITVETATKNNRDFSKGKAGIGGGHLSIKGPAED